MKNLLGVLLALPLLVSFRAQDKPFEIAEGDRVVFLGNTFVERDLHHNHLETFLVTQFKDRAFRFRNLGWSGDTVFGHARGGFGSVEDGFKLLSKQLDELKPTVVLAAYGMNESFEGEKGLDDFRKGLARLLDRLATTGARVVLVSPIKHENLGPPYPNPAEHNRNLELYYVPALRDAAKARGLRFADLFSTHPEGARLTENGIHLTDEGYRRCALQIAQSLGCKRLPWMVDVDTDRETGMGARVAAVKRSDREVRFEVTDDFLPAPGEPRYLKVRGLAPGRWTLKGRAAATAEEWAKGVALTKGPEFDQAEKLRATIAEKNLHYFNYWRPQNETYIFGFRKREQGHLQPEIPQFLPVVAEKEAAIEKLKNPVPQAYVLELEK